MRPLSLRATPLRVLALSAVGLAMACSAPSSPPSPIADPGTHRDSGTDPGRRRSRTGWSPR